jgi:hypothetical protein
MLAARKTPWWRLVMKRVTLALASLALVGISPALAQYYVPRPPAPIGPMAADDVLDIVEGMGLRPVGPAMPNGPFLVQRARDDYGRLLLVTVDARRSQVVAVEAAGMRRGPYARYAGFGPQRRIYPGYAIDPDDEFAAPGSVMAPRAYPVQPPHAAAPPNVHQLPHAQPPQKRATKSAAIPQQRTPVPRKRPASAPEQAAAGSVEPVAPPAPAASPATSAAPAAPAATHNATPPVTPLE